MDQRYLNFPVSQIPYIITNRYDAMEAIISYAIVSLAYKKQCTFEMAGKFLGVDIADRIDERANRCHTNSKASTSIKMDTAFEFRDHKKTDFDITCLCANLAIRSIIGRRAYCLCRKNLIFSRMSGEDTIINKRFYKAYVKPLDGQNGRRRWEKVRDVLKGQYGVSFYAPPGCRGFYVSYTLSEEDLAITVDRKIIWKREQIDGRLTNAELHERAQQHIARTP